MSALLSAVLSVLTVASVGFAVVMILINLLLAGRRSWIMSIVRVGMTLVAAILALPVAKAVAGSFTDSVYDTIVSAAGDGMGDFLGAAPEGLGGLRVIISMLIALVLYIAVFLVLRLLFAIVGAILCRVVPVLRQKTRRGVSMPLGALNGLLIVACVLAPLCGFLAMSGNVLGDMAASADKCESEAVDTLLEQLGTDSVEARKLAQELDQQPVVSIVSSTVGRPIFAYLASDELEYADGSGKIIEMDLERDLSTMLCTFIHLTDATEAMSESNFDEADKSRLYNLSDSISRSEWVTVLATDALASLAEQWKQGATFAGLERPSMDKATDSSFNSLMDVLAAQTPDTLDEDLHTLFDVTGDLLVSGLMSGSDDSQQLIKNAANNEFFSTVANKLDANDRFDPVAREVRMMSVRLVSGMLGTESLRSGEHDALMVDVSKDLTSMIALSVEERHELLPPILEETFGKHGYEMPQNVAIELADQMIADLGADGEITDAELTEYLIENS